VGVALLGLVGVGALAAIEPLRARFAAAFTDQGSGQRTQHLQAGLEAVRQHPLVGIGAGQFTPAKFGGEAMAEHVRANPGKAHNQFVSVAAEAGVPGALGFLALLAWLGARAWRRPLGAVTLGALALFVTLSLAHDPLFQAPVSMALVLCLGLGLSAAPPPGRAAPA
jgi:O-antigen ligase